MYASARIVAVISALILAAPLTAASSAASGPDAEPQGQRVADCNGKQLDARLGRLGAAAGSKYQTIRFTNIGDRRCVLQGYPDVSFRGKHHRQLGWPAKRVDGRHDAFVLRPGRTAKTSLQIPDWHNYPVRDCQAKGSPRLRVVPPGTHRTVGFHYPAKTCTTKKGRSLIRAVHRVR